MKGPGVAAAARSSLAEIGARVARASDSIAPPSEVALAFVEALGDGSLAGATRDTLIAAFGGSALGGAIGLAFGIALGLSRPLDRLMELPVEMCGRSRRWR